MAIDPKDLLACVMKMTPEQHTRFCNLLNPTLAKVDSCPMGSKGPQDDPGSQSPPAGKGLLPQASPEMLARLLYRQMTGKRLEIPPPADGSADARPTQEDEAQDKVGSAGTDADAPPAVRDIVVRPLYGDRSGLRAAEALVTVSRTWRRLANGHRFTANDTYRIDGDRDVAGIATSVPEGVRAERTQVSMTLVDVIVPGVVYKAFMAQYGHVIRAKDNHLHVSRRGRQGALEVRHCVLSSVGPVGSLGDMVHVDAMTFIAIDIYCEPTYNQQFAEEQAKLLEEERERGDALIAAEDPTMGLDDETRREILYSGWADDDWTATLGARWERAAARWQRLFANAQVPTVRSPATAEVDLERIEALLYDKETRGINPLPCPCGCGGVIGCEIP